MTRAFLYVRVSKEREDGVSPEIQESEARAYCERKGWLQSVRRPGKRMSGPPRRPSARSLGEMM